MPLTIKWYSIQDKIANLFKKNDERFENTDFPKRFHDLQEKHRPDAAFQELYDDMIIHDWKNSTGKLSRFKKWWQRNETPYPTTKNLAQEYLNLVDTAAEHNPTFWEKPVDKTKIYIPEQLKGVELSDRTQVNVGNNVNGQNDYHSFCLGLMLPMYLKELPNEEKEQMIQSIIKLSKTSKGGTRRLRRKRRKSRRR